MEENKMNKFSELSKPISEFLMENCHPYYTAIIDTEGARLVETIMFVPQKENAHCEE